MATGDELDSFFDEPDTDEKVPVKEEPVIEEKEEKPKKEPEKKEEKKPEKKDPKKKEEPVDIFAGESSKKESALDDEELDTTPDEGSPKAVVTIYAKKGEGKTWLAFSSPGKISCISFDRKSQRIAMVKEFKDRVTVYDGLRYLDKSSGDSWIESSVKTWEYVKKILDRIRDVDKPDWIVIDGGEIVHTIFEMVMRARNDIRPFQGIANKNVWKYRRMLIDQLLTQSAGIASIGVIWTAYVREDKIMEDGDYVAISEVPNWIDAVLYETDAVIRASRATTKNGQRFYATVESSKIDSIPNGPKLDVTDEGMKKLFTKDIYDLIDKKQK